MPDATIRSDYIFSNVHALSTASASAGIGEQVTMSETVYLGGTEVSA